MTAVPSDVAPGPILPEFLRRYPLGPAEGWLSFAFAALLALTVAWSLDDAAWVLGDPHYGDFYAWAALLGTTLGFVGAKVGWRRWVSHLVTAGFAALLVPIFVGAVLVPHGGSLGLLYRETAESAFRAWRDLAILNRAVTQETGHYLLVLGLLVWSVGQFVGYTVFGHRRPLDAIIVVGIVLLGSMALTAHDQLTFLVIFTIAALGLLARAHAFEEQTAWVRRRIGDAGAVRSLYLRGGSAFIAAAVFGSLVLTASASSAPLAGAWAGFGDWVVDASQWLQRYLPVGGAPRPVGFGFGPQANITGVWSNPDTLAAVIRAPPGDRDHYYWRAVAYDRFDNTAWAWTGATDVNVPSGEDALAGQADDPIGLGLRREVSFAVEPVAVRGQFILSPQDPLSVDRDTRAVIVGGQTDEGRLVDGYFSALQLSGGSASYVVKSLIPVKGDEPGGRTENRLRAAGQAYPTEIRRLYLSTGDAMGPYAKELLEAIRAKAGKDATPYDLALTMQDELRTFIYDNDVSDLPCQRVSVVECFAHFRQGYCQYYASTMAILLREAGIPTRLVQGFLPGTRDTRTGVEQVRGGQAHAWVEVYFPGHGWQMFDPTGGGLAQTQPLPSGEPVPATPSAPPTIASVPPRDDEEGPSRGPGSTTGPGGTSQGGPGPFIAIAIVLLVGVVALGFLAWQRGPRGEVTADGVWRSIARTAARFGFGPRPAQTVYEYAGALGDVLPGSKPELQTVAHAKVEVAYGRRQLGAARLSALRDAQRRLRLSLLRLAFRRGDRPKRRRRAQ